MYPHNEIAHAKIAKKNPVTIAHVILIRKFSMVFIHKLLNLIGVFNLNTSCNLQWI